VTETHDPYRELERRWRALCASGSFRLRELACPDAACTLLCVESGNPSLPTVAIAAGVHGDEPAGPWALLALAESQSLDSRFAYRIWPCTNPNGLRVGARTNAGGIDVNRTFAEGGESAEARAILRANRDRVFLLSLDLHEDCDASGFYCYEYGGGTIGFDVIATLEKDGFPIDPLDGTFEVLGPLDGVACTRERGRIAADRVQEAGLLGGLSYSLAIAPHARHTLTFETPSSAAWGTRLAMHGTAVRAAIGALP
jgi:murein peptide amidase A